MTKARNKHDLLSHELFLNKQPGWFQVSYLDLDSWLSDLGAAVHGSRLRDKFFLKIVQY
jgi:hypothetical protein